MPATLMRARVGRVRQARGRGPARSRAPARGAYRLEGRGQVQLHLRRPRERHEAHLRLGPHAEAQARVELDLAHLDDDARARGARVLARGNQRVRGVHARLREVAPELGAAHPEEHGDVEVVAVEGVVRVDDEVAGRQVAVVEALGDGHRVHLRRRVAQLEVDQLEVPDEAVGGGRAVRGVQVRLERLVEERGHLRVQDRDDDVAPQLVQQAGAAADATATEVYRGRVRSPRDTNRRAGGAARMERERASAPVEPLRGLALGRDNHREVLVHLPVRAREGSTAQSRRRRRCRSVTTRACVGRGQCRGTHVRLDALLDHLHLPVEPRARQRGVEGGDAEAEERGDGPEADRPAVAEEEEHARLHGADALALRRGARAAARAAILPLEEGEAHHVPPPVGSPRPSLTRVPRGTRLPFRERGTPVSGEPRHGLPSLSIQMHAAELEAGLAANPPAVRVCCARERAYTHYGRLLQRMRCDPYYAGGGGGGLVAGGQYSCCWN